MAVQPTIGDNFEHGVGVMAQSTAVIGTNVRIGHYNVIGDGVRIGNNVRIGHFVTIHDGTVIEDGCRLHDYALVGKQPKLSPRSTAKKTELEPTVIGAASTIGSHTVIMAGTKLGHRVIVGDNAGIRERCTIGNDTVVGRSVTVENDTTIGERTKIQTGAYITAYVTIEDDVFIAPMVVTTNDNYMGRTEARFEHLKGCTIRQGARVGGGAHILPGVEIGEEAFVATAAVVTRDVPPKTVVMGVPAKPTKDVPVEELLENQ